MGMGKGDKLNESNGSSDLIRWCSPSKPKLKRRSLGSIKMDSIDPVIHWKVSDETEKEEKSLSGAVALSPGAHDEEEGISDMKTPKHLLHNISDDFDLKEYSGIEEEEYYASLFARCDTLNSGMVSVSKLMESLKELRALAVEFDGNSSFHSISSSTEELEALQNVLDPKGEDPLISIDTFRDGIQLYLRCREWSAVSPVKTETAAMSSPRSSSPRKTEHGSLVSKLDEFNLSCIEGDRDLSLEAFAGTVSASSSMEQELNELTDYIGVIADQRHQIEELKRRNDFHKKRSEALWNEIEGIDKESLGEMEKSVKLAWVNIERVKKQVSEQKKMLMCQEDRVRILQRTNDRLENQLRQSEKKSEGYMKEAVELREQVDQLNMEKDVNENQTKTERVTTEKKWKEREHFLKGEIEHLSNSNQALELRVKNLELEREELATQVKELTAAQEGQSTRFSHEPSFDLDVSGIDSIQAELLQASIDLPYPTISHSTADMSSFITPPPRFDVATQAESESLEDFTRLLDVVRDLRENYSAARTETPQTVVAPGEQLSTPQNGTGLASGHPAQINTIVEEIHQELIQFRDQLKKSHELLHLIKYESSRSLSLTKSCPGLPILKDIDSGKAFRAPSKVSIAVQTDSPIVETPLLAQKLGMMMSPIVSDSVESGSGSLDKLSDDGSVRVRDDLSVVYEEETEGNPAHDSWDRMNDRGSLGGRRKLQRMENAVEDDHHHSNHHHHHHHQQGQREDDFVSVTSSQGESVYLSLERPLKVTVSSGGKGEEDRSSATSGAYRSCHSSMILLGSGGRGRIPHADSDTASLVSEGNTTFGSPFSSPSSPYWTPSQGSSSQETLTPVDGDTTPVNNNEDENFNSASETSPCNDGAVCLTTPSGRIQEDEMETMFQLTYNPSMRSSHSNGQRLSSTEWRQLRQDRDQQHRENYTNQYQQEEGNDETLGVGGLVGVQGTSLPITQYAFHHDEQAAEDLDLLPSMAEDFFREFDALKDCKEPLSEERFKYTQEAFQHMAEIFQTEHCKIDERLESLSKDYQESQESIKRLHSSLKRAQRDLNDICKSQLLDHSSEALLGVIKSLGNITEEYELYSSGLSKNARRLGMLDNENRVRRLMEVVIFYVHSLEYGLNSKYDGLKTTCDDLSVENMKLKELLKRNNIQHESSSPSRVGRLELNNKDEEKSQREELQEEICEGTEPERAGQFGHLLYRQQSNTELPKAKERLTPKGKKDSKNPLKKVCNDTLEFLRRELYWAWSMEDTMKWLKQSFALVLTLLGIFVFLRSILPTVDAAGCRSEPSYMENVVKFVKSTGQLQHHQPPII